MSQLLISVVTERQSVVWTVRLSNSLLTLAPEYPTLYCGENPYPKRLKAQLTVFECGKVLHGRDSSKESFSYEPTGVRGPTTPGRLQHLVSEQTDNRQAKRRRPVWAGLEDDSIGSHSKVTAERAAKGHDS